MLKLYSSILISVRHMLCRIWDREPREKEREILVNSSRYVIHLIEALYILTKKRENRKESQQTLTF